MAHYVRPRWAARPSRPGDSERGSVAIPMILLPLALFAVMAAIHLALLLHGRNVAAAAAQDALHTAAQFGANAQDGEDAGERTLQLFAGVQGADVDVNKDEAANTVTVVVSGEISAPLAGFLTDFTIEVTGPIERFYAEDERG